MIEEIKNWAIDILSGETLLMDVESTGGSPRDEMIDLCIVDISSLGILYNSLLKPTALMNPHAQRVHNISYQMLRKAPYLEDEYVKIDKIVKNKRIITYNVAFDRKMFRQSYDKYYLDHPPCDWDCLMLKCTKLFRKQIKLDLVCDNFNIQRGTHRAASDALAAAEVIHRIADLEI